MVNNYTATNCYHSICTKFPLKVNNQAFISYGLPTVIGLERKESLNSKFSDNHQKQLLIFAFMNHQHEKLIRQTIEMAAENVRSANGGPFAALVVREGQVIGRGVNRVTTINDPTAHAEVMAIRDACRNLDNFRLENAVIYTSCEPCPMCLGAIYWARISQIYYAAVNTDAAKAGFDDSYIYQQIPVAPQSRDIPAVQIPDEDAFMPFQTWIDMEARTDY